jgi:hypothetical protein
MEGRVAMDDPDRLAERAARWREAGASHLTVDTMGEGWRGPDAHIAALAQAAAALSLA